MEEGKRGRHRGKLNKKIELSGKRDNGRGVEKKGMVQVGRTEEEEY